MQISPDKQAEQLALTAMLVERTDAIQKTLARIEASFQDELDDVESRVDTLEKDKNKVLGMIMAVSMIFTGAWAIGGDFIKDALFSKPAIAQTIKK